MFVIGYNLSDGHYSSKFHCERPERVSYTISKLKEIYPESHFITGTESNVDSSRSIELISLAHSKSHVDFLLNPTFYYWICRNCKKQLSLYKKLTFEQFAKEQNQCVCCETNLTPSNIYAHIDSDTYFTIDTPKIIFEGVCILDQIVQKIISGQIKYGFALIRPPGHHCCNKASGFCICNNAVIATRTAQNLGLSKVLILDIDFHHGDGTQTLITDPNLLPEQIANTHLISIHGFGPEIYPGTGSETESTSNVLNIPIHINRTTRSRSFANDEFYQGIITNQVKPYIENFNPDLIVVSLGVDAHRDDLLEGLNITDETYVHIASSLKDTNKPIIFVLEGGYNVQVIHSVVSKMIQVFE